MCTFVFKSSKKFNEKASQFYHCFIGRNVKDVLVVYFTILSYCLNDHKTKSVFVSNSNVYI